MYVISVLAYSRKIIKIYLKASTVQAIPAIPQDLDWANISRQIIQMHGGKIGVE